MQRKEIRLLLLDFDGTLADTQRANTLAYVRTLREAGYDLTEEEYEARYFGMRCDEFLTRLGIADPEEREQLRLRKIALYPTFFDTVRLNRPLWDFCRQFRAQGGRVWVVSTGSRANIDNVMRHLGIGGPETTGTRPDDARRGMPNAGKAQDDARCGMPDAGEARDDVRCGMPDAGEAQDDARRGMPGDDSRADAPEGRVDGILSGADVAHAKPAPDCFLEAMRREGCTPEETLIFEDSEIGLEAARRSGAAYIRIRL